MNVNIKRITAALVLAGGASAVLAGTCTDTLYLQSFKRYQKTYHVKKTGAIDSTSDTVSVVASAGRLDPSLILPVAIPAGNSSVDSVLVPLAFAANCGSDSVSLVRFWRGIDTPSTGSLGVATRKTGAGEVTRQEAVRLSGAITYQNGDGSSLPFLSFYSIAPVGGAIAHYIGVLDVKVGALGGVVGTQAVSYKKSGGSVLAYSMHGSLPSSGLAYTMSYQKDTLLKVADSVVHGSYDSLVVTSVGYATVYNTTSLVYGTSSPTGISRTAVEQTAFSLRRTVGGWSLSTQTPAVGFVRDVRGHLLRTFPVATSFEWDGRAASGAKVASGVYLVGFEGQGTRSLALP